MTFEALQLAPALLKAVQEMGFETPTPIQQQAIPAILEGSDLMAAAQTGTGKTGGFGLPILHLLSESPSAKNKKGQIIPRALVLAPTRELAAQIDESFRAFGQHLKLKTMVIYGGVSMNPQIQRLQRGVDIIIATPGRLLDLYQQGFVNLSQCQFLVLDEADRMLDMGFIDDIHKIIDLLPQERQSLLFSATFSEEIRDLAKTLLQDPLTIEVTPRNSTVKLIQQIAHPVARARKPELLLQLIQQNQWFQTLIFTRTKSTANKVEDILIKYGIRAAALHGNKSQAARTTALKDFKSGRVQALVATDIAARGIDIEQLPCVINYDLPNNSEDYIHRIGRTGRAGAEGVALSLVTVDEAGFMQQIEKLIGRQVERIEIEGFAPPASEVAMPIVMGRQVIWGGIGKAPSHKATAEHVKKARQSMAREVSENRAQRQSAAPAKARNSNSRRQEQSSAPSARRTASDRGWGRNADKDILKNADRSFDGDSERSFGRNSDSRPARSSEGRAPRSSEGRAPRSSEGRAPRSSEGRAPRSSEGRAPRSSEGRAPRSSEGRAPRSSEGRAPRSSEGRAPRSSEGRAPRSSEGRAPRSSEGRAPRSSEGRAPRSSEGRAPRSSEGRAPRSSEGRAPRSFGDNPGKGGGSKSGFRTADSRPRQGQAPQRRSSGNPRSSSRG